MRRLTDLAVTALLVSSSICGMETNIEQSNPSGSQGAENQKIAKANFSDGTICTRGQGVPKGEKKAVELCMLSALSYANGHGVPKDEKKAVELYTLSAAQGNASAQYNLGVMYANGHGVPKDEKKALELYTLSAAQGNASAQNKLGVRYPNGHDEPKDETKASQS